MWISSKQLFLLIHKRSYELVGFANPFDINFSLAKRVNIGAYAAAAGDGVSCTRTSPPLDSLDCIKLRVFSLKKLPIKTPLSLLISKTSLLCPIVAM